MRIDVLLNTNRFNLSKVMPYFVNDSCFGEDFAGWLRSELLDRSLTVSEPYQEDWGWYLNASVGMTTYFIGFGGTKDESSPDPNQGEWRVMIAKQQPILKKIFGKKESAGNDDFVILLQKILAGEETFQHVQPATI